MGFPGRAGGKEPTCQCRRLERPGFDSSVGKMLWVWAWQPTPASLLGESHGHRSLGVYSPKGCKESDMTETRADAHTHTCTHISSFEKYGNMRANVVCIIQYKHKFNTMEI